MHTNIPRYILAGALICTTSFFLPVFAASDSDGVTLKLLQSQITPHKSVGESVKALIKHYPSRVDTIVKTALKNYPGDYEDVISSAIKAEPALCQDIVDVALELKIADKQTIIDIAIGAEPPYASEIDTTVRDFTSDQIFKAIKHKISLSPTNTNKILTQYINSYPDVLTNIYAFIINDFPEYAASVIPDIFKSSDDMEREEILKLALNSLNESEFQKVIREAKNAGVSEEVLSKIDVNKSQ